MGLQRQCNFLVVITLWEPGRAVSSLQVLYNSCVRRTPTSTFFNERVWHLPALSPTHGFFNSSARMIPTSTSIDRAKVSLTSFIDKTWMISANLTAIDNEEWLLVQSLQDKSIRGFFQMQSADEVTLGVGLFSSVICMLSVDLRVVAFWGELNSWFCNCSDEVVWRVRWPGQVITLLHFTVIKDNKLNWVHSIIEKRRVDRKKKANE